MTNKTPSDLAADMRELARQITNTAIDMQYFAGFNVAGVDRAKKLYKTAGRLRKWAKEIGK